MLTKTYYKRTCYFVLLFLLASSFFYSCDGGDSKMNGYWKLTSIKLPDQTELAVDSQFYAFQKEEVFSFTRLLSGKQSDICYGYADYPDKEHVHIVIDQNHTSLDFPTVSHWNSFDALFEIKTNTTGSLILEKGDTLFILKKF